MAQTARREATATADSNRFEADEADFRRHYQMACAHSGQPYEHWAPAYRYGYTLAHDPRYGDRDWPAIEVDARRDWEQQHKGTWEERKDAIRYAWGKTRGQSGHDEAEVRIPVVEEQLQVGTRPVEYGGVRVHSRLTETPVEQQVSVREEHVRVERRRVDRPAEAADLAAFKEETIEVTETTEEPVVRKQARVVEEVVVSKEVEQHTETIRDHVRQTKVEVEPIGREHADVRHFSEYEHDFRTHVTTALAGRSQTYEHWAPAYRYGYDLAADPQYRNRDWPAIEADARRGWEQRHKGTWEQMKDAIRYAWDAVRGRR
jgi:stress response protein YsnF